MAVEGHLQTTGHSQASSRMGVHIEKNVAYMQQETQ